MKNNFFLKYINNFLYVYLILKVFLELDGNVSLRYFTDDLTLIFEFGDSLFVTAEYLFVLIALLTVFVKLIFKISNYEGIEYLRNSYLVDTASLLFILLFFRIYDIERLYLLLYIVFTPLIDYFSFKIMKNNFNFFVTCLLTAAIILFSYLSQEVEIEIAEEDINTTNITEVFYSNPVKLISRFDLSEKYEIEKYRICCNEFNFYELSGKSTGYLQSVEDKLLHVSGFGTFSLYRIEPFTSGQEQVPKIIKSNIEDEIDNSFVFDLNSWESIKDILLIKDEIFLSYIEEKNKDCTNVSVLRAKYSEEYLEFESFFTYDECANRNISPYNAHQSGGKLLQVDDSKIILTTGDFRKYQKAQSDDSLFGKVIEIDIQSNKYRIISKGHRNPQGISETLNPNIIISTEHGPKGGDEINVINLNLKENFGWPISSYGSHYSGEFREDSPLHKSHSDHGFKEPAWFFTDMQNDVHGISDIIRNYFTNEESYFVGTMKATLLYEVTVNLEENLLTSIDTLKIGERIRDIEYYKPLNIYFLLLEETPAIAVMKLKESEILNKPTIILE